MNLPDPDLQRWLAAVTAQPDSGTDFMPWLQGPVRAFFPFNAVFMAHGELMAGQIRITHWLADGHEPQYLEQLAKTFELEQRGSLKWWLANRLPFCIDPQSPPPFASKLEIDEIRAFGFRNVAAHGVLNLRANAGTYFSFAGLPGSVGPWHLDALRLLTPILNDLYLARIATQPTSGALALMALTRRQRDIVRLVATGIDDKTVGRHLGVAEKTVRNQLCEIYFGLGVHKRAQLVAMLR